MRNNKINYMVVGAFVIAMLVGLLGSLAILTGRTGATDDYYTVYDNVTGVKFGTQVLYEGYPIGQVEEVTPRLEAGRMRFRVDFSIQQGWRLPEDSIAEIAAPGLLAAITLSIHAGESATALEPGNEVHGKEAANIFAVMASVAGQVTELSEASIKPLLANIDRTVVTLGDILGKDTGVLVRELTDLAMEMAERLPVIADNVEGFTVKLNQSSDQINALLKTENREKLESFIADMEISAGNFKRFTGDLSRTQAKLDRLLENVDVMIADNKLDIDKSVVDMRFVIDSVARHIEAINHNMEGAARNMYEFSRQIRQNPGLLLGGTPPKDEAKIN